MNEEVTVTMLEPAAGPEPALLLVGYELAQLIFQVDRPEQLAQWLALLFQYREDPDPAAMSNSLVVGHYGADEVRFLVDGDFLLLYTALKDNQIKIVPQISLYIPRDCLDDLADGLAHEHRQWVEHPAP